MAGAVENADDQEAAIGRLEENNIAAVSAGSELGPELGPGGIRERRFGELLAVFADFADERERSGRVVDGDEIANFLEVNLGLRA